MATESPNPHDKPTEESVDRNQKSILDTIKTYSKDEIIRLSGNVY